jgi:cell division septation protein DedD
VTRHDRDSTETVSVRNLEQIQEHEPSAAPSKVGALVMASFGGACIVFCALGLMRSPQARPPQAADPLGDLVAAAHPAGTSKPQRLDAKDVTFPGVLTDRADPTTAMAALAHRTQVRAADSAPAGGDEGALPLGPAPGTPPPAADQLPVVPLPAQDMVGRAPVPVAAADTLQGYAQQASREPEGGELSPEGRPGGYQLQVSSFKTLDEAAAFALALRRRGHKAHVEQAHVQGRGDWFRVRIGPFKYKRSADIYRQDFEAKERMVSFIVVPPKTQIQVSLADGA